MREIPVGNAPYDVVLVGRRAYVSNWAGRLPAPGDATGPSGDAAPVRVDPVRNIANDGSVSVVDLDAGREIGQIVVGLHPSGIVATPDGRFVLVANANSDTISVIDRETGSSGRDDFHQARGKAVVRQCSECLGVEPQRPPPLRLQRNEQLNRGYRFSAAQQQAVGMRPDRLVSGRPCARCQAR